MQEETSEQDLRERLALIEKMIAEGRRSTESWGWMFVLWGAAYCVAIGWATWGHGLSVWGSGRSLAWPVTKVLENWGQSLTEWRFPGSNSLKRRQLPQMNATADN